MAGIIAGHVRTVILEIEGTADSGTLKITDLATPHLVGYGEFEQFGKSLGAGADLGYVGSG